MKHRMKLSAISFTALLVLAGCSASDGGNVAAGDTDTSIDTASWSVPALVTDCGAEDVDPAGCVGPNQETTYESLSREEVTEAWSLCATLPHLKDSTWVGINYGLAMQAERLDINLSIVDAGGYENLAEQVSQIEDCVSSGADAILVSAVSYDSLNQALEQAKAQGIKIIDVGNGVSFVEADGRVLQDYIDMGTMIASHLLELDTAMKIAVLPGPAGAGWSERSFTGIQQTLEGSNVEIVDVKYGDTGREIQLGLVEDVLAANPDIDALVGNAVMLEAATAVLAEQGKTESVGLYGTYVTPELTDIMSASRANCAPSEQSSLIGQISVDLAVRVLQGDFLTTPNQRFAPVPLVICGPAEGDFSNIDSFDEAGSFAPEGFQPVSVVRPVTR